MADETLALNRNKYKSEAYKVRGFALQNLGRDSLAIIDYDKGLEYNPTDKYFLFYKAVAQTSLRRFDAADSTFNTLLRANPAFEDAWCARARLNLLRNDTTAALADIDTTLRLSQSILNAYLLRASINADRQQWTEALQDIDEAVKIQPDIPDLYINRAYLRYNNEDFFGAMADYNYALQIDPDNELALFNRALLRFQVKELDNAAKDFTHVLSINPQNFHARYNRGLVYLELDKNSLALKDFNSIADRYPRFYPVYYAIAETQRRLGNLTAVGDNMRKAENLVKNYIASPEKNPLDRPKIEAGKTYSSDEQENLTEEEVMARFNRLVTTSAGEVEQPMAFNDKIKGRVQDRSTTVTPEPEYALSFIPPQISLRSLSNYFRELDDINQRHYLAERLYLVAGSPSPSQETEMQRMFDKEQAYTARLAQPNPRPVDFLARGVLRTMLKNYEEALRDFTRAIEANDNFSTALLGRSYVYSRLERQREAIADLDEALRINPRLVFAWFNKGVILYNLGDYTSAMQAFAEAIRLDPSLGAAYYNRGLCYMHSGNRNAAFADLSKAGELGVIPSYNLLKRMK